jgi:hypothetical protein
MLWFTKLNKVFTYGIVVTRGSQFAHLRMAADGGEAGHGEATRRKLVVDGGRLWAPPTEPRAPAWASVFDDLSGMVDLARAVAHQRGGELNTAARVSIFVGQNSA